MSEVVAVTVGGVGGELVGVGSVGVVLCLCDVGFSV